MRYLDFLASVHQRFEPARYLEIGIRNGVSLSLSRCRSVGIDPAYSVTAELDGDVALVRSTSDEFFARPDPLALTGGRPFDLAFIDGLHLFEFALRDFVYAERCSTTRSAIIFDDVLPRNVDEAARMRHTGAWTGDVYGVLQVLAKYRPELAVIPVGTRPTGLLVVMGLDPADTTLADNYDAIIAEFRRPDPQPIPDALLDRLTAVAPQRLLDAGLWELLRGLEPDVAAQQVRDTLAPAVADRLGRAFAPAPRADRR